MPRARAVAAPPGALIHTGPQNKGYRLIAGSMGAPTADLPPIPAPTASASVAALPTLEAFEPGSDVGDDWVRQVAAREAAAGLPAEPLPGGPPPRRSTPAQEFGTSGTGFDYYTDKDSVRRVEFRASPDLSPLPSKFALDIERKDDGWWVIRAGRVHPGLFVAGADLGDALAEAVGKLAEIVRLDGERPVGRKKK